MKWHELNRYGDYRMAERALTARLEDIEASKRDGTVKDTVSGSMREYPYVKRVIKIEGVEETELYRLEAAKARTEAEREGIRKKMRAIERWIDGVRDPYMREIARRRILEGRRWENVSMVITEGRVSGDCIRMQLTGYVRKHPRG